LPVELPALIGTVNGSVGDTVFTRNQYGPYSRARTTPTNPNTALQASVRRRWAQVIFRWQRQLSDAQRQAWREYAAQLVIGSDRPRPQRLTGQQVFQRFNYARRDQTLGFINDPPTIKTMPPVVPASCDDLGGLGTILYAYDNSGDWGVETGGALILYVSAPFNAGTRFCKGPFRFAEAKHGFPTGPPSSPDPTVDPWGTPGPANRWAKTRIVRADGRVSAPVITPFATNT
jgi:hypothetical protein